MKYTYDQVITIIKNNQSVPSYILAGRKDSIELCALVNGENFHEELIDRIEHIESDKKAKARRKYSRSVVDFFSRLLSPINNVFSSSGGLAEYRIKSEVELKQFLSKLSNLRDGKSLRKFVQDYWVNLYHTDPNGLIFLEYSTAEGVNVYPTYKSIHAIRAYKPKGQCLDYVLFEPVLVDGKKFWRFVDSEQDFTIVQDQNYYTLVEDKSFDHPFGEVPAVIISDIVNIKAGTRQSPFVNIVPLAKEYARDQSIKTLYKFLHGFPTHWKYVSQCRTCTGTGRTQGKECIECDGHGYLRKKDVTDEVTLPIPNGEGVKLAPDIAGFISPDLATWDKYTSEIELLDKIAYDTHWGTHIEKSSNETATGRFIDVQPVMNKLNQYADTAEWVEWKLTELIANALVTTKRKEDSICLLVYGRRFIIESPDVLLKSYNEAKLAGANITVLDRLFSEYISAKYMNDPDWLRTEITKSKIEPYVHLSLQETSVIFGANDARKKAYFQTWWSDNKELALVKDDKLLRAQFETEYETIKAKQPTPEPTPKF